MPTQTVSVTKPILEFIDFMGAMFKDRKDSLEHLITTSELFADWFRKVVECPECGHYVASSSTYSTDVDAMEQLVEVSPHFIPNTSSGPPARILCLGSLQPTTKKLRDEISYKLLLARMEQHVKSLDGSLVP